jgi:hypothetical protein
LTFFCVDVDSRFSNAPLVFGAVLRDKPDLKFRPGVYSLRTWATGPGKQLPEMLVCLIVWKQPPAVDSTIHDVVPAVLHDNA